MATSEEKIQIEAMRTIATAPLLMALADNLHARGNSSDADLVREMIPQSMWAVGGIALKFDGDNMPTLHLRLSRVPSGYCANIYHPPGYERAIREKFLIFRDAARGVWREARQQLPEQLRETALRETPLRETETAFYWSSSDKYWVGIVSYYTDNNGKEYIIK